MSKSGNVNRTAAFSSWDHAKQRCLNPRHASYKNYGARGITFCERWLKFSNFRDDMGDPPPGMSLDRIDCNKGYEPSNCRWAPRNQQNLNRRLDANSKTGVQGVWWDEYRGKYRVQISVGNKTKYLGVTADINVAREMRIKAEFTYHKLVVTTKELNHGRKN